MDMATRVHQSVIEVLIAESAGRCATFADLLASLPGVGPADAAEALDHLAARHLIDAAAAERLNPRAQPRGRSNAIAAEDDELPRPHPLDYDWRFTPDTAEQLRARCVQLSDAGDTVALLGTPTVLRAAATRPHGRRWALLEASTAITAVLEQVAPRAVMRCDLARDELPRLGARVVTADPPWYREHTRVFLWAAAQISAQAATILLAQPSVCTRPGILAERSALLSFARACGLETVRICPAALQYSCPPFERLALERSGLADAVPENWRRGDLIELRHADLRQPGRPTLDDERPWREVVLDGARLRFRLDPQVPDAHRAADPRLIRLVEGDVLASVSRRDPVRQQVVVWTASNRVFGCHAPGLLAAIARALADREPVAAAAGNWLGHPLGPAGNLRIEQAADQLTRLTRAELATGSITGQPADSIGPPEHATRSATVRSTS